jgi:hypothetical protein
MCCPYLGCLSMPATSPESPHTLVLSWEAWSAACCRARQQSPLATVCMRLEIFNTRGLLVLVLGPGFTSSSSPRADARLTRAPTRSNTSWWSSLHLNFLVQKKPELQTKAARPGRSGDTCPFRSARTAVRTYSTRCWPGSYVVTIAGGIIIMRFPWLAGRSSRLVVGDRQ